MDSIGLREGEVRERDALDVQTLQRFAAREGAGQLDSAGVSD